MRDILVRDARDEDSERVQELIRGCRADVMGWAMDLEGADADLRDVASSYYELGGRFWVAERKDKIVGCIGVVPGSHPAGIELRRLAVAFRARRQGLASRLCELAELEGYDRNALFAEAWSDTRAKRVHALLNLRGYVRDPQTRRPDDRDSGAEFYYRLELLRPAA